MCSRSTLPQVTVWSLPSDLVPSKTLNDHTPACLFQWYIYRFHPQQNPQWSLTWLPVLVSNLQTSSTVNPSMTIHLATCTSDKFTHFIHSKTLNDHSPGYLYQWQIYTLHPEWNLQWSLTWLPVPVKNLQTSVPDKTLNDHSPGYLYQWQIYRLHPQ